MKLFINSNRLNSKKQYARLWIINLIGYNNIRLVSRLIIERNSCHYQKTKNEETCNLRLVNYEKLIAPCVKCFSD